MCLSKWLLPFYLLLIPAAMAAQDVDTATLSEEGLAAERRLTVETELALNEDQENAFWPLYDEYYDKRTALYNKLLTHVNHYANEHHSLSDEQALNLIDEHLALEAQLIVLHQEYRDKLQSVLTPKQLMRFYQIDFKITAKTLAEIADMIPLAKLGVDE